MKSRIPVVLLALSLAACEPRQPEEVPGPPPSPADPAPSPATPDSTPTAPADPTGAPAAPAQPAPSPPAPTEPSAAPKPTASAAAEPPVSAMAMARPGAKMSVAVDLRYHFDAAVTEGQPATLHLAAISRVDGSNLRVEVKPAPGIETSSGALSAQKVDAAGVYRRQLSVTRHAGAPDDLRVLVTMDMPEGTAFGYYTIPLAAPQNRDGNTAQKSDSVKQR